VQIPYFNLLSLQFFLNNCIFYVKTYAIIMSLCSSITFMIAQLTHCATK
jgi:hypothetical protein